MAGRQTTINAGDQESSINVNNLPKIDSCRSPDRPGQKFIELIQTNPFASPTSPLEAFRMGGFSPGQKKMDHQIPQQQEVLETPRTRRGKITGFRTIEKASSARSMDTPRTTRRVTRRFHSSEGSGFSSSGISDPGFTSPVSARSKSKMLDLIARSRGGLDASNSLLSPEEALKTSRVGDNGSLEEKAVGASSTRVRRSRSGNGASKSSSFSDNDSLGEQSVGASTARVRRSRSAGGNGASKVQPVKDVTASLPKRTSSGDSSTKSGLGRSSARLSVRERRALAKPAITIQCIIRRFLARTTYQKKLAKQEIQNEYLEYIRMVRRPIQVQQEKLKFLESQVMATQLEAEADIHKMRLKMEEEKEEFGRAMRTIVRSNMKNHEGMSQQAKERSCNVMEELGKVEEEERALKTLKSGLEGLIAKTKEENEKLQESAESMIKMNGSLAEFIAKKREEQNDIKAQRLMFTGVLLPSCKRELEGAIAWSSGEERIKNLYRNTLYKQLETIRDNEEQDLLLFLAITDMIRECEEDLGCEMLNGTTGHEKNKTKNRNAYDDDEEDEDSEIEDDEFF